MLRDCQTAVRTVVPARLGLRLAAICAALAVAPALRAFVPPLEQIPPTLQVPAPVLPDPLPYFTNFVSRETCVLASRGDSPNAAPTTAQPTVLRWWERDAGGGWTWRGTLTVPGWPALQPIFSNLAVGSMHSRDGSGQTMLVVPVTSKQLAVARYEQGAWTSLGVIDSPLGELITGYSTCDGVVFGWSSFRVWRASLDRNGAWQMVQRPLADLGFSPGVFTRQILPISAEEFLFRNSVAGGWGGGSVRYDWISATSAGIVRGPAQPALVPDQAVIARLAVSGGTGVALVQRFDIATGTVPHDTLVFLERGPKGVLAATQVARVDAAAAPAVGFNALAAGRVVAHGRLWMRASDGTWLAGAAIGVNDWIDGTSVLGGGTSMTLVDDAFDCDGDGIDDAIAIAAGAAVDCNANGHPDVCDIALGMVSDTNDDHIPDPCAGDCDGNGVADIAQIRQGAREGCGSEGTLASCQIAAGALDRDGNGVPDTCDPDRDGNGIPDVVEIAKGIALDCDGDWRIDDAPAGSVGYPIPSQYVGWSVNLDPTPGLLLMTCIPAGEALRSVDGFRFPVTVGTSPTNIIDGRPMLAFVAVDPTYDLDPRDAQVVWSQATVFAPDRAHPEDLGGTPQNHFTRLWQYVATPHLPVDAPAIWIGFTYPTQTLRGGASSANVCALFNALSAPTTPFLNRALSLTWAAYTTQDIPSSPEAVIASSDFAPKQYFATVQVYSHGCPLLGDVTGDGLVDGADLGHLLGNWGPAYGSACDLNRDNMVDDADLKILLANFTVP